MVTLTCLAQYQPVLTAYAYFGRGVEAGDSGQGTNAAVSRRFHWGDGTADTVTTGTSALHTYAVNGTHTVTLTATLVDGSTLSDTEPVTVASPF